MPKKIIKKSQDSTLDDFDDPLTSPEKKRSRPNFIDSIASDDEELPPTRISQNDPLFQTGLPIQDFPSSSQEPKRVTDEEWNEMLRLSRKEIPGIKISPISPARRRRQKLQNKIEGRRLFNNGQHKTSTSPKNPFDQLLQGIYFP